MNGQGSQQMPILKAVEGGAVIVVFKTPCQLRRRGVIKGFELFRRNHQLSQSAMLQFDAIPDS
jgi:hypothetical protein